jgi:ATP-dependent RNA helicase DeaD
VELALQNKRDIKRGHKLLYNPGRMQDMINRGLVNISQISFCILDEADEMLNMGFWRYRKHPINYTRRKHMVILCNNACWSSSIGKQFMKDPIEITVGLKIQVHTVSHEFYLVNARDRYEAETFSRF